MINMTRKIALWGAGIRCRAWLASGFKEIAEVIFDNAREKHGTECDGIPVCDPQNVEDWHIYYIVIVSDYINEISIQLSEYGLKEYIDYISYEDYYYANLSAQESAIEALKELFEVPDEIICKVQSKAEYHDVCKKYSHIIQYENALNIFYKKIPGKRGGYYGQCEPCGEKRIFRVDYSVMGGSELAWRETFKCQKCGLNSRMRFILEHLKRNMDKQKVYIYEQITLLYRELRKVFPDLTGSEYLRGGVQGGSIADGIMHQDAMNLSFEDCCFDMMVSCDVLEHIEDYKKALRETYRCLKKGGKFIFTIPFFTQNEESIIRAKSDGEGLRHLLPPVYHGNPLSTEGSLVFTDFSWDILQELRDIGFAQSYGIVYFSSKKGYLGNFPMVFEAIK